MHPETNPLETNRMLGSGNGHAQSSDLFLLVPQLLILRLLGSRSIIDLGSGDGYVVRVASRIGFHDLLGVEMNNELCDLAKINVPKAEIYQIDFSKITSEVSGRKIDLVYLFNPSSYEIVITTCKELLSSKYKRILAKNFVISEADVRILGLELAWSFGSYNLYRHH